MKNSLTILIGLIIVAVLVLYMFVFQVRYNETAVRTTFGKAETVVFDSSGSPYFKWPWPIQDVKKYPTRVLVLDDELEQIVTADGYSVIIRLYVAWRISDPYEFYSNPNVIGVAEERLRSLMQDLRRVINKYNFDQLVNVDPSRIKLAQIEQEMLAEFQQQVQGQKYGIAIERVGVRRVVLPEKVTQNVFERMRKTRERMAADIDADGKARAADIVSEAESVRSRILTFAQNRAQQIRTEGDLEAAKWYSVFAADEQFAIYLRWVESLKLILSEKSTFIIDAIKQPEFNVHNDEPAAIQLPGASN